MSKRYAIWDKKSQVITPVGEILTNEQWIQRYPLAAIDGITVICSAGIINGGYFGILPQMKLMMEQQGYEFKEGLSDQEILDAIEEIEDSQNISSGESTAMDRVAAALEYQNATSLPVDETLTDPDIEEV